MTIQDRAAIVLQQIDAALVLAEKATPGPWQRQDIAGGSYVSTGNKTTGEGYRLIACVTAQTHYQSDENGDLIATSRTLLPASLRCLKTAIEGLLVQQPNSRYNGKSNAAELLTTLCDQWETSEAQPALRASRST